MAYRYRPINGGIQIPTNKWGHIDTDIILYYRFDIIDDFNYIANIGILLCKNNLTEQIFLQRYHDISPAYNFKLKMSL
jgi:hypothetical protein